MPDSKIKIPMHHTSLLMGLLMCVSAWVSIYPQFRTEETYVRYAYPRQLMFQTYVVPPTSDTSKSVQLFIWRHSPLINVTVLLVCIVILTIKAVISLYRTARVARMDVFDRWGITYAELDFQLFADHKRAEGVIIRKTVTRIVISGLATYVFRTWEYPALIFMYWGMLEISGLFDHLFRYSMYKVQEP